MAEWHERPLWKDVEVGLARRAGAQPGAVRTWEVAAGPGRVTVTGRRGGRRDVLLATGCSCVESFGREAALALLEALREAVDWTWPG